MFDSKKLAIFLLMLALPLSVSAANIATADVSSSTIYKSLTANDLTYTVVQKNNDTIKNCTIYDNLDGSWGVAAYLAIDTSITNGTNTVSLASSSLTGISNGDTFLWNVLCKTNGSTKTRKDATNATLTYVVYQNKYSTTDLNEQVVDVFGTAIYSGISWVDLLVLLAFIGVGLSIVTGILYKGGRIVGLG